MDLSVPLFPGRRLTYEYINIHDDAGRGKPAGTSPSRLRLNGVYGPHRRIPLLSTALPIHVALRQLPEQQQRQKPPGRGLHADRGPAARTGLGLPAPRKDVLSSDKENRIHFMRKRMENVMILKAVLMTHPDHRLVQCHKSLPFVRGR